MLDNHILLILNGEPVYLACSLTVSKALFSLMRKVVIKWAELAYPRNVRELGVDDTGVF